MAMWVVENRSMDSRMPLLELAAALAGISLWFLLADPALAQRTGTRAAVVRPAEVAAAQSAAAGVAQDWKSSRRGNGGVRQ